MGYRPSENERKQNELVAAARAVLKPAKVNIGKVPPWMQTHIRKIAKQTGIDVRDAVVSGWGSAFEKILAKLATGKTSDYGLDHWGSSTFHGRKTFTSEPYGISAVELGAWEKFAELAGLNLRIHSNTYHFPGDTIRLDLYERQGATNE